MVLQILVFTLLMVVSSVRFGYRLGKICTSLDLWEIVLLKYSGWEINDAHEMYILGSPS